MSNVINEWCGRAWSLSRNLPGEVGNNLRTRWEAHSNRNQIVLTLFGPYDSGKSSLLKRLLVDSKLQVPEWLTVSGRRETFELKEAVLGSVIIRDTPGIAGGNDKHELLANDALLMTDVIAIVLPPQLITSNRDTIFGVINGSQFLCPPTIAYKDQSLLVILSRMDEAGAMPRDDIEGYHLLVERKITEFKELIKSMRIDPSTVIVNAVSADPFGLIGNTIPSGQTDYDADREWDGMDSLAHTIQQLSMQKDELRLRSEIRFLGAAFGDIQSTLKVLESETRIAKDMALNEAKSQSLYQDKLKALLGAARADLDKRIEEEISASARRGAADINELTKEVQSRLDGALERWMDEHNSALQTLFQEADVEMKNRHERPAWKKLLDVLNESSLDKTPKGKIAQKGSRETIDRVQTISSTLHKGFREIQPATLGMTLEKARNELQRLKSAASFEEYAKQTAKSANRLRDAAHVAQARRAIFIDVGFSVAVPAILEFGGLLAEWYGERKAAKQRAERREKIRKEIEKACQKLKERAWGLWCDEGMPAVIEEALGIARMNIENTATALEEKYKSIADKLSSVQVLLSELATMN